MGIVKNDDLPEMMKNRQKLAHALAENYFYKIWEDATQNLSTVEKSLSGNDALAYFGTIISSFTARFIFQMIKIAGKDDTGINQDEIVKETLNGILAMLGGAIEYEEENPLPDGIKKLKK